MTIVFKVSDNIKENIQKYIQQQGDISASRIKD